MQSGEALPLVFSRAVTLVGAGPLARAVLDEARAVAPELVAADSGADRLAAWALPAAAVVGDMDSVSAAGRAAAGRIIPLDEQETTDFEKCLYATVAPLYLGVGFTGGRMDHSLAVLHAMLRRPDRTVVLLDETDAMALVPPGRALALDLRPGARVSIFPLAPVTGTHSRGLRWSVQGLRMAAGQRVGTSNVAQGSRVELGFDAPGALLMLDRRHLRALLRALC